MGEENSIRGSWYGDEVKQGGDPSSCIYNERKETHEPLNKKSTNEIRFARDCHMTHLINKDALNQIRTNLRVSI